MQSHTKSISDPLLSILYTNDFYNVSDIVQPVMSADDTNLFWYQIS